MQNMITARTTQGNRRTDQQWINNRSTTHQQ